MYQNGHHFGDDRFLRLGQGSVVLGKTPVYQQNKNKKFRKFVDIFGIMRIILFCMDTKNNSMMPECGKHAKIDGNRFVVGAKQLRKALQTGQARMVYLAKDADPAITAPLQTRCETEHIPCVWIPTMWELGSACGIEVGAAAAAAID